MPVEALLLLLAWWPVRGALGGVADLAAGLMLGILLLGGLLSWRR